MRILISVIFFFAILDSFCQTLNSAQNYHLNFKKHIFYNTDSASYYLKRLHNLKKQGENFETSYYYNLDAGQYHFVTHNLDSSEYHYKRAFKISHKAGDSIRAIDSDIWIATHRHFNRKIKGAAAHWMRIYEKSKKVHYVEGIANSYMGLASLTSNFAKKIEYGYKIDSLYTAKDTISTNLVNAYNMMGDIYLKSFEDSDLIKKYAEKSLEISNIIEYPYGINSANLLLAESATRKKEYNEARIFYNESLKMGIQLNDQIIIDGALLNLGKTYLKTQEPDKTIEFLKKCSQNKSNDTENSLVGWVHLLWAETYLIKKEYVKVFEHLTKTKQYGDIGGDSRPFKIDLYNIEHKYFSSTKNYKAAYEAKEKYDKLKKSLEEDRNKNAFVLNEQKKNQQEIALLKSQNELAEQQKKSQRNLLLAGISLSSLAGIFLFILYRNRQKTNKKLREIDALKTNFFTNISHEFRTPLTLISTPIQEFLEESKLSNEKRKHFEIAQKNTTRLSALVDQLLELSKIDSGNRKLLMQLNMPTQMVAAWSESFVYLAQQKKIDFKIKILDKDVQAWFDREALENIVVNLLGNAIKYTPDYGEIDLKVSIQNKQLNIFIKNTGKGLTNTQIKTIFNRFYQTNNQNEGVGVGLSLVKEFTELHGGKINVTSELNKWTLFEVSLCLDKTKLKNIQIKEISDVLPMATTRNAESSQLKGESEQADKELPILLIVEDNTDVRTLLADTFKKEYNIVEAVNGEEGTVKALDTIPDIIISDVMMPVKDGVALTKTLKNDERTSHIPIILLTAKAGDENELTGIEVGADDYITKPFNQKILKSKTASLIALRRKLQSRYSQEVILKPKDIAITSIDEKFLERVQKILDEKLVESTFSAEQFSKAIHMSRMQLHRKLKALTGLSTSEFIKSQRLKLAVQILKSSDINISEVGYSIGFNDHAYFSKCFKEAYNCTPSEFSEAN